MESKSTGIIVLSGGTSARFGSDKSGALIGGQTLIARILTSIPAEFEIIVVGPDPVVQGVRYVCVQENPLGGGPLSGFKAGLDLCTREVIALTATDMPFAIGHIINLLNSMTSHDDAVMYVDPAGFKQPLAAVYRADAVKEVLIEIGDVHGKSMRNLVSQLRVREIPISSEIAQAFIDIDTQADLERAIVFSKSMEDNSGL